MTKQEFEQKVQEQIDKASNESIRRNVELLNGKQDSIPEDQRPTVLGKASMLIYGARERDYGKASENFANVAKMWSVILGGKEVTPLQVCLCMDALKTCRLINQPLHEDSLVDKAGYVGCYEKVLRGL